MPKIVLFLLVALFQNLLFAKDYYVHPLRGNDNNLGNSKEQAFQTLERASKEHFSSGDRLFLAHGQEYKGTLLLVNKHGSPMAPIVITSIPWNTLDENTPAIINFKSKPNGIYIKGSSYISLSNISITGNGFDSTSETTHTMRCGVLIVNSDENKTQNITLSRLNIFDIFYENEGFKRGKDEVKTANGTQHYGWGIRVISTTPNTPIENININSCQVENVSHTGIKLTGMNQNISALKIYNNLIKLTGGPGIQMSEVKDVHVHDNIVTNSGSNNDSRKWGRGSGLWTWGSSRILIEKNRFLYANGPGDSAGAHIDFNCDNIVLQYNISAYNAGGFCEILGNNYNCAYRYNLSINDGYRIKGVHGAFQEGKTLWLSGYQGNNKKRKGPVNSYIYNNTIVTDATIVSKMALDNTSSGILIANNIFYLQGKTKMVLGDQYKPETKNGDLDKNIFFQNNLFLRKDNWPKETGIEDANPIFGDPGFEDKGSLNIEAYIPKNIDLVKGKGIDIPLLPKDETGILPSLNPGKDILGNPIGNKPSLGAIEVESQ